MHYGLRYDPAVLILACIIMLWPSQSKYLNAIDVQSTIVRKELSESAEHN